MLSKVSLDISAENHRLKKRVKAFEEGKVYSDMAEENRVLKLANIRLNEALRKETERADSLQRKVRETGAIIKALSRDSKERQEALREIQEALDEAEKRYDEAMRKIAELQREIEDRDKKEGALRRQIDKSSENSSLPSSMDRPGQSEANRKKRANERNGRVKSGRSPGAQKGHPHHPRKAPEGADRVVENPAPRPGLVMTGEYRSRKVVEISVSPFVTEYRSHKYVDPATGEEAWAPFPEGVRDDVNYGSGLRALIAFLYAHCNVSVGKIRELLDELTGGAVSPSAGFISKTVAGCAEALSADILSIKSDLLGSEALNVDATAADVCGASAYVTSFTNGRSALYTFMERKTSECYAETILGAFAGGLIHDHETALYGFGDRSLHQECLVHLLRYSRAAAEEAPSLGWPALLGDWLSDLMASDKGEKVPYESAKARLANIIAVGKAEYAASPPSRYEVEGPRLLRRIEAYSDEMMLFLRNPAFGCENNICERLNRVFKRKMKQAMVFRSREGIEAVCDILSVIQTARMRGGSAYRALVSAFEKKRCPSRYSGCETSD